MGEVSTMFLSVVPTPAITCEPTMLVTTMMCHPPGVRHGFGYCVWAMPCCVLAEGLRASGGVGSSQALINQTVAKGLW